MLTLRLTHPQLLEALASAGHGAQVLLADGNYPVSTGVPASAARVNLNLMAGCVSMEDTLAAVSSAVVVESVALMHPGGDAEPPVHAAVAALLPGIAITRLSRESFYRAARADDTCLVVATGEQRLFANVLLTLGAVPEGVPS